MDRSGKALALTLTTLAAAAPALGWGETGHELVNRAAARALPDDVPAVLRERVARLTYLGPEPDRWRLSQLVEMDEAFGPDHFLDLELTEGIVDPAAPPPDRYAYMEALVAGGQDPSKVGLAPYRVVELCQRIEAAVIALALADPGHPEAAARRRQAEENLVHVAGVLGH